MQSYGNPLLRDNVGKHYPTPEYSDYPQGSITAQKIVFAISRNVTHFIASGRRCIASHYSRKVSIAILSRYIFLKKCTMTGQRCGRPLGLFREIYGRIVIEIRGMCSARNAARYSARLAQLGTLCLFPFYQSQIEPENTAYKDYVNSKWRVSSPGIYYVPLFELPTGISRDTVSRNPSNISACEISGDTAMTYRDNNAAYRFLTARVISLISKRCVT